VGKYDAETLDRCLGAVIGAAVGDALGAGYEFTLPKHDTVIEMKGGGHFDWAPGEWTDDTQMSLAVLEALGEEKGEIHKVAANFLEWFDSNPPDVGTQTREVLGAAELPQDLMAVSAAFMDENPDAAGNGGLMRTSPVPLIDIGNRDVVANYAKDVASLTHAHPDSINACILWSLAIQRAVKDATPLNENFDWIDAVYAGLEFIEKDHRDRWDNIITVSAKSNPRIFTPNGWVVSAFQAALSSIVNTNVPKKNPSSHFRDALVAAIKIGDDTDTVASIAGAFLGARWGESSIPVEWSEKIHGYRVRNSGVLRSGELERMVENAIN